MKKILDFGSFSESTPVRTNEELVNFWDNNISEAFGDFSNAGEISKIQREYISKTGNKGGNPEALKDAVSKILEACGGKAEKYFGFVGSSSDESVGIGVPGIPQLEIFGEMYARHGMLPSVLNSEGMDNIMEATKNMFSALEDVLENESAISEIPADEALSIPKETIDRIKQDLSKREEIEAVLYEYYHIIEAVESDDFEMLEEKEKDRAVECLEKLSESFKAASQLKENSPKFFDACSIRSGGSSEDIATLGDLGF